MTGYTLYLFSILYSFLQVTESSFLFYDSCKDYKNVDDCVKEYGCGWCNITDSKNYDNNTIVFKEVCSEINICPTNNSDYDCIVKSDYYYNFNCFLFSVISWILYLCAIFFICLCFFACFHHCGLINTNDRKRFIGPVFILTIFAVSIVLLCNNAIIFSGFFLTLCAFTFVFFIFFTYRFIKYKNNKNEYRASYYYDKNNQKESLLN